MTNDRAEWVARPAEAQPVDVVREYLAARDAYDNATRPPNSHAPTPRLKHGDPVVIMLREARIALDDALAQQPAAVECDCPIGQAEHMSWCAISKAQDAQQGGRSDD